jgi:DNA-binding transcriptional MocR family regulator
MRMLYMDRRRALVNAIHTQMGDMFEMIGAEAGMHLVALLHTFRVVEETSVVGRSVDSSVGEIQQSVSQT